MITAPYTGRSSKTLRPLALLIPVVSVALWAPIVTLLVR